MIPTFRFFTNEYSDESAKLVDIDWNFSDAAAALKFNDLYRKYKLASATPGSLDHKHIEATIDNFDILNSFNTNNEKHFGLDKECIMDHDNTVAYIDRGKKKTVVALGGGSWYKSVYERSLYNVKGLEHVTYWAFHDLDANEFNVISFREQIARCYRNPVLYDSQYYNGFHDSFPSLESMAKYITSLFPDSDFYILADCKLGHSGALLGHYLAAKKFFFHSSITSINPEDTNKLFWKNDNGDFHIDLYNFISFEVYIRSVYFKDLIPPHLLTVQDIIDIMPESDFCFYYHSNDNEFLNYARLIKNNRKNIKKFFITDDRYTVSSHYIVNYLRKHNIVNKFFL